MFFATQTKPEQEKYENLLKVLGSLSNLFSDSNVPYLYYRGAERAFCKAFGALDHSRGDTAIDAGKGGVGVGLKTFLDGNGKTFQKVAEFNKESVNFRTLLSDPEALVREISRLRNERLAFAQRTHKVEDLVYHCVTRKPGTFLISEEKMDFVDIERIRNVDNRQNTIHFNDGIHQYNFSITKSTLLKQFDSHPIYGFDIEILKDPFEYLDEIFGKPEAKQIREAVFTPEEKQISASVILPLYSERGGIHVPDRSGLNQWNARGRTRKTREVYIQIPAWIYSDYPGFFPDRDTPFELSLPNGKKILAKVCQGDPMKPKALMSNPNTDLGEWLIDEVLKLPEGQIVTYGILQMVGADSVEISKQRDGTFAINFKKIGSYENFKSKSVEGEKFIEDEDE